MITFKPILRKIQPIDFCRFLICYLDIHIDKNSRKDAFVAISLTVKVTLTRLKRDVGIISQGKTENVIFVGMGLGMNFIFCSYVKIKLL